MKQGEIQTQLAATNRWWRNPRGWAADDPDLREAVDAPFVYEPAVLDSLTPGGLYVLRGPRRVGKSVEVKRAIQRLIAQGVAPRRIVHMSVDGWRAGNLGLLVDAASHFLLAADQPRFWFLDEITSITDGWPERIKWLRDNHPRFRTDTVVLTGSSAVGLTESTKALAGRRGPATDPDRVLLPMGFRAFTGLVGDGTSPPLDRTRVADLSASTLAGAANELAPWLHDLVGLWETYLQVGGFPRSVASYLTVRQDDATLLQSLLDVIHGDAFRASEWSRTQTTAFLRRLAKGLGSPANHAAIAQEIGTSASTASRRIANLQEAFVVWPAHQEHGLQPNLKAQAKLYFTDPIYTRLTAGVIPEPHLDLTVLSEQQLGMALVRNLEREQPGSYMEFDRVLYHRTPTRKEIDFVGPEFGGMAIESKYIDGRWRGEAQTLAASRWRGVIATRTQIDVTEDLAAVPAALLAFLLDV
jgi:hypothetical protein